MHSRVEWRHWLESNHLRSEGVWLITFKKSCSQAYLSYNDMVEEALCFGWIDSMPRKLDEQRTMLWFAPRQAKTGWSKPNKERIERMQADGTMTPAGLAKIEAAKQDGSWTLLDTVEQLTIPDDLAAEFLLHPGSAQNFEAFPRSVKRGILEWIIQAKTLATRTKRIQETARLAAINQRANQWRKKDR